MAWTAPACGATDQSTTQKVTTLVETFYARTPEAHAERGTEADLLARRRRADAERTMDCPFCPRRFDDDPLKEIDSSARNEGKGKQLKKFQKHEKAAANCECGAIFKRLAPACSICGKGDATTAKAVREDGERLEELRCRQCRQKKGKSEFLEDLAEKRCEEAC